MHSLHSRLPRRDATEAEYRVTTFGSLDKEAPKDNVKLIVISESSPPRGPEISRRHFYSLSFSHCISRSAIHTAAARASLLFMSNTRYSYLPSTSESSTQVAIRAYPRRHNLNQKHDAYQGFEGQQNPRNFPRSPTTRQHHLTGLCTSIYLVYLASTTLLEASSLLECNIKPGWTIQHHPTRAPRPNHTRTTPRSPLSRQALRLTMKRPRLAPGRLTPPQRQ